MKMWLSVFQDETRLNKNILKIRDVALQLYKHPLNIPIPCCNKSWSKYITIKYIQGVEIPHCQMCLEGNNRVHFKFKYQKTTLNENPLMGKEKECSQDLENRKPQVRHPSFLIIYSLYSKKNEVCLKGPLLLIMRPC